MKKLNKKRFLSLMLTLLFIITQLPLSMVKGADNQHSDAITTGYRHSDTETQVKSVTQDADYQPRVYAASAVDAYYKSADISPARNQSPYGACWTFATMSAAESSMLKSGKTTADLSEMHLAYFTYHSVTDPLGGTTGDINNSSGQESFIDIGGNYEFATRTLTSWVGAVDESKIPYSEVEKSQIDENGLEDSIAYKDAQVHLQNVYRLAMNDGSLIKQAILKYGSVGTNYYADNSNISNSSTYYNNSTYGYYCTSPITTNHAVSIVGWDDNYSADNFNSKPEGDGAWIVKNSWGSSFGENGYFYLSYYDKSALSSGVTVFDFESADNYDNNYQYDGAMTDSMIGLGKSSIQVANVFQASANADGKEKLEAVSFDQDCVNVDYEINIYTNLTDKSNPESGTKVATKSGKTTSAGYYTIALNQAIELTEGEDFAIVVNYSKDSDVVTAVVERSSSQSNWYTTVAKAKAGQSFIKQNSNWVDFGESHDANIRIKAFTTDEEVVKVDATGVALDKTSLDMEVADTQQLTATVTPEDATNKNVTWKSSNEDIVTVDATGIVTAVAEGKAVITVETEDGKYTDTCDVTVNKKEILIPLENISLSDTAFTFSKGDTKQLKVTLNPENTTDNTKVTWESFDEAIATVDENGMVTAVGNGGTIIRASIGGLKASCIVTVRQGQTEYDGVDYAEVFDPFYYADCNPDVKSAYGYDDTMLLKHFVVNGMNEGRIANKEFNVIAYRYGILNDDLRAAFGDNNAQYYTHYINFGKAEGRLNKDLSSIFDATYYLANNTDVANYIQSTYGSNNTESWALWHYCMFGMSEGRRGSAFFGVYNYIAQNPDVYAAYKQDLRLETMHYINCGINEKRSVTTKFDMYNLPAVRPDVIHALGNDKIAWVEWYIQYGIHE